MKRTYKYLLRPTKEQAVALDFLLWQARRVYNMALEQRIKIYAEQKNTITSMDQWAYFRDLRHSEPDNLSKFNALGMNYVLRKLDVTFQNFFRRVKQRKAGESIESAGFPRFKSRNRFKSFQYKNGNGCKFRVDENQKRLLHIQNVGEVRMVFHRPLPADAKIKQVVFKQKIGRWYAYLILELPDVIKKHSYPRRKIGIDVGIKSIVALSNKEVILHPHWLENSLAKLRVLQRKAARQQKGSKRQSATYKQVAKLHEHIANQRNDFYHKLSKKLSSNFSLIGIEALNLAFMNQSKNLSRTSYDAGIGGFRSMLLYKAVEAGGRVIAVKPAYTTQMCSRCGYRAKKSLAVRIHKCPVCGVKLDRDVNAAKNILKLAKATPSGRDGQALK